MNLEDGKKNGSMTSFRIPEDLFGDVAEICKKEGISKAYLIRKAIRAFVEEYKKCL